MKEFEPIIQHYLDTMHSYDSAEHFLITICNCKVPSDIILSRYYLFTPIEQLPDDAKNDLKQFCIQNFPGKSTDQLVRNCKVIHCIGNLIS